MQESTSHAWFTEVQEDSSELEDFELVVGDNTQVEKALAAAQSEERAADDVHAQETPGVATQDRPAAVHVQVKDAPGATQHVAFTNAFHVEKVNPLLGSTTVFIDSVASIHMVSADSPISQHVVETSDWNVRIKGSFGTSTATKEGTLKFGTRNAQDKIIPVALEVLLVPRSEHLFGSSFGRIKCDILSTPPVLRRGTTDLPISTEVPRMYFPPKAEYDPFLEPGRIIYQSGSTKTKEEDEDE